MLLMSENSTVDEIIGVAVTELLKNQEEITLTSLLSSLENLYAELKDEQEKNLVASAISSIKEAAKQQDNTSVYGLFDTNR